MNDYENWNDEYQDDIESQGLPLIRLGQSNTPKVLEGVFGIGEFLMPNGLVAKCYQFLAIGCDDLWVHWAANRGGLLGVLPGSETPPGTAWLKPGVPRDGYPMAMKEGRYAPDGSLWERTIYLHSLIVGLGRPTIHLDEPICGTFAFKGKSCEIGQSFYRSRLKAVEALIDGRRVRNMTLALWEMSSEPAHGRNQYSWKAPKPTLVAVFGQPGGPSIELSRLAKTLRDSFKQGRAWASEPLPAIAAPPPEAPRIPAAERVTPKPDIRSGPDAWKSGPPTEASQIPASKRATPKSDIRAEPGASTSDPPISPDEYDDNAGGPRSLDEVIFD
jgi:hypothetical protein